METEEANWYLDSALPWKVIGGSGTMSLILERESYVNLNFSKQNGHFGIRIEHEFDFKKRKKGKEHELCHEVISILDLITNHERNR